MLELCPSWRFVDRMCLMICGFGSCLFTMLDSCRFVEFVQLQSWITRLRGIKHVSRDRDIRADYIRDSFLEKAMNGSLTRSAFELSLYRIALHLGRCNQYAHARSQPHRSLGWRIGAMDRLSSTKCIWWERSGHF